MRDDTDVRLDQLFTEVRSERINTEAAEEFFETRLMARISERRKVQRPWYELAWRCVPGFALVTVILAVCSITFGQPVSTDLFAAISSGQDEQLAKSILSGE